jgi:CheY-like chemotaxis protein
VVNLITKRPLLLAEDNANDVLLIRLAFKKADFPNPVFVVHDGLEVIQYLKGDGQYADRGRYPMPGLLLLDINMPKLTGFDVLSWIRRQPEHASLPVIVLTTSYYGPEINRAYELGANSFITKPADLREFVSIVTQMAEYWLGVTRLPQRGGPASTDADPDRAPADADVPEVRRTELGRGCIQKVTKNAKGQHHRFPGH